MKLSTFLTSSILVAAVFCTYGIDPDAGRFADEQPERGLPESPESLQTLEWGSLRAPGASELNQPLGRLGLGLADAMGQRDARGTSAQSYRRWSALLHSLFALLLFWIFHNLSGSRTLALLGALLVCLHPMVVEPVTWISMSARLMASVWMLLGIALWSAGRRRSHALSLIAWLLALVSHPVAWPMGCLMLALSLARKRISRVDLAASAGAIVGGLAWLYYCDSMIDAGLSLGQRMSSAPAAVLIHLRHVLAWDAAGDVIVHPALGHGLGGFVLLGWLICISLAAAGIWLLKRDHRGHKCMGMGLLWFLSFSLGSALLPYGQDIGSDSDAYLALPGLGLFLLGTIDYLLRAMEKLPRALSLVLALLILLLGAGSLHEIEFRKSKLKLLMRALDSERSIQEPSLNFVAHRRLGFELLWHGDLTSAEAHLKHALALQPEDSSALVGRGRIALQRDEKQKALILFQAACKAAPGSALAWERLGEVHLRVATPESNLEAIKCMQRAVDCDPYFVHAYARMASLLSLQYGQNQEAQLKRALEAGQRAIALNPESMEAWSAVAASHARLGDPIAAQAAYEISLAIEPDYSRALAGLGALLSDQGDLQGALQMLERTFYLHPLEANNAFELARVHLALGQAHEAREFFRVTLSINPRHMRARQELGRLLLDAGQTEEAIAEGEIMLQLNTSHQGARLLLAEAYECVGRFGDAIVSLKIATGERAGMIEAQAHLALLMAAAPEAKDRDIERAMKLAQALVQSTESTHAPSLRALAAAQAALGQFSEAVHTIERAIRLNQADLSKALAADARSYAAQRPLRLGN